jgi:hypothetical protein
MTRITSILLLLTFVYASAVGKQEKVIKETKKESKVCHLVLSLSVVRNADNYVRKVSKGKRHLFTYIASNPTKEDKYYYVDVAEDNGMADHTRFIFRVDPKTYAVKYLDLTTVKRIPLKLCEKRLLNDYSINKKS